MWADGWTFESAVWEHASFPSWAFATVPAGVGDDLRLLAGPPRGFGAVRVEVTLGASTWQTSVFPDGPEGYLLPLKSAVRRAEGVDIGDTVRLALTLPEG